MQQTSIPRSEERSVLTIPMNNFEYIADELQMTLQCASEFISHSNVYNRKRVRHFEQTVSRVCATFL
jgi:hypothetical protein